MRQSSRMRRSPRKFGALRFALTSRVRIVLATAGAVGVLAVPVVIYAPAGSAASSAYAVTEVPVGTSAFTIAADPMTNIVYAVTDGSALAVINGASNTVTAHISLPDIPMVVAVDQASDTVYAIVSAEPANNSAATAVVVINGATNTVTGTISLPDGLDANAAAVNPVTHMIYVTDVVHGTVEVVNGSTKTVAAAIPLADPVLDPAPYPRGVAVDTATNTIYVSDSPTANFLSQVDVIDGATNKVSGRIALPTGGATGGAQPAGLVVDSAAGRVYVADEGSGVISVINVATDSVSSLASGLELPQSLALDAGAGTLYATSLYGPAGGQFQLGTTYVIDTTSGVIGAEVQRGGAAMALTPGAGDSLYIDASVSEDGLGGDVTVITPSAVNTMSPIIMDAALDCTVGLACQTQVQASAIPAATFSSAELPAWLTLTPSGLLSGTPPAGTGGIHDIPVTATNGVAPADTSDVVASIDEPPAFTSANHTTFYAGVPGSFTVTVSGYPGSNIFVESGTLPAGVYLQSTGVLSGTPGPGTAGVYPIQIGAFNTVGPNVYQAFTLTVSQPALTLAVAGLGTGGVPVARAPQLGTGTAWQSLGGTVTAPPAVAAVPNPPNLASPLFIAPGTNHTLYIRGVTGVWQRLGPQDPSCLSVAAVITGPPATTLTLACEGLNHALYYGTAPVPGTGLPTFNTPWKSLGGVLAAGPAVAPVGGTLMFFIRGTDGKIYTRTATTGYRRQAWSCLGQPAAAQQAATGKTFFACEGANHLLYEGSVTSSGPGAAVRLGGGTLAAGPAIAAETGAVEFLAELTDHAVWERTATTSWTTLGGTITGGIQAAGLN